MRSRIADLARQHKLQRFVTLTLDPASCSATQSHEYIRRCWREMRVYLQRRFGESVRFIGVLEFQKSGYAHLHVLVGVFVQQAWLKAAWTAVGGGRIVDVKFVDVHNVAKYLTGYLAGEKIQDSLERLPDRARIFSASRGLVFAVHPASDRPKWSFSLLSVDEWECLVGECVECEVFADDTGELVGFQGPPPFEIKIELLSGNQNVVESHLLPVAGERKLFS